MAVEVKAYPKPGPLASNSVLSASRGGTLRTVIAGLTDLGDVWLAVGKVVGGPPSTFGDFDYDRGSALSDAPVSQAVTFDESAFEFTVALTYPLATTALTMGDEIWVGVFVGGAAPPGASEVPEATAGPFTVIA